MPKSKISLSCIECKSKNYTINKSSQERLVLKKFCKNVTQVQHIKKKNK